MKSDQNKPESGILAWYHARLHPDDGPRPDQQVGLLIVPGGAPTTRAGYTMNTETGDLTIEVTTQVHAGNYTYMMTDFHDPELPSPTYISLHVNGMFKL